MRIVIATDAWAPQVNGVVRTLTETRNQLQAQGHDVLMVTPEGRKTVPCPTYPEIQLSLWQGRAIARELDRFQPDCIHIATEGTLGMSVRRYCRKRRLAFTTAYHTQFPEYIRARFPIPLSWTYAAIRWFHGAAVRNMVPTPEMQKVLLRRKFRNPVIWTRGVDTGLFVPDPRFRYNLPGPIWVYVGRVAVEKNIEAFLKLPLEGSKVIIGDGPDRERLAVEHPDCHFLGYRFGAELAAHMAGADVFVFPSVTDTYGLVMLEAMACGVPVAAFPVTGPIDVVDQGVTGILDEDLAKACREALQLSREQCRRVAEGRSWAHSTAQFVSHLTPAGGSWSASAADNPRSASQ